MRLRVCNMTAASALRGAAAVGIAGSRTVSRAPPLWTDANAAGSRPARGFLHRQDLSDLVVARR